MQVKLSSRAHRSPRRVNSLHLEIVGSQFRIVDVQDCLGIETRGDANLWKNKRV